MSFGYMEPHPLAMATPMFSFVENESRIRFATTGPPPRQNSVAAGGQESNYALPSFEFKEVQAQLVKEEPMTDANRHTK